MNDPDEAPPPADTPSVTLVGDTDRVPGADVGGGVGVGLDVPDGRPDGPGRAAGGLGGNTGSVTDTVGVALGVAASGDAGPAGDEDRFARA